MRNQPEDTYLFRVGNRHNERAGKPPKINGDVRNQYYGYFENEHGEQAVFVYNRETRVGTLWLGDAGWETPYNVIDGLAPALILSREEETWLQACWNAANAFDTR